MEQEQSCDHCKVQIHCRNLFVALKILEEELRFADRADLWRRYRDLQKDVETSGYRYPNGQSFCSLADKDDNARALVMRADALLRELRRVVSISPA